MQDVQHNGRKHLITSGVAIEVPQDEQHVLSVKDPLQILRRRLWVVVLVAVVCAGAAYWYSLQQAPTYKATTKILIGQSASSLPSDTTYIPSAAALQAEVQGLRDLTPTMAAAVKTRPVAEAAVRKLGFQMSPDAVLGGLKAERDGETQFINVEYQGTDPEETQQIANAVSDAFSEQIYNVNAASSGSVIATVWERATLSGNSVGPSPKRNGALGLVLGCVLGIGLAFLLEHLDNRWRSPEEVEQVSGAPIFGVIPRYTVARNSSS